MYAYIDNGDSGDAIPESESDILPVFRETGTRTEGVQLPLASHSQK